MATNKKGQELFTINGTVVRGFQPEYGQSAKGKYTKNKFLLKTLDGRDIYITKFGQFNTQLIGKDVTFQATQYNETNYTVQGEVSETTLNIPTPTATVAQPVNTGSEPTRRRGRPSKADVPVQPVVETAKDIRPAVSHDSGREAFRGEAEASVVVNLQSAIRVLGELNLKGYGVADLVAVADLIGRTTTAIFMDAQKEGRMARFSK